MNVIYEMMNNTELPVITAFMLGLLVALHPCPLATNIAVMGYIARGTGRGRRVFVSGMYYILGRILAYSLLGAVLLIVFKGGGELLKLGEVFGEWGERLLSPLLIIVGLYFLLSRSLHKEEHCPDVAVHGRRFSGMWGSLCLGFILALSFCPESAIVYFGMLMPLSAHSAAGFLLPVVFSVATAIPTVVMAWVVAYGLSGTSVVRERMHLVQSWITIICGVLFIGAGIFCFFF